VFRPFDRYLPDSSEACAVSPFCGLSKIANPSLLSGKYLSKGLNTPDAIVERYAPASENSPEARANYKAHIVKKLGLGSISDQIGPGRGMELAQAMAEFENGIGGGSGGDGPKVIAQGDPKQAKPQETRVVNGQVYVKVDGRWYRKTS
jgi:hypothetical protein